MIFIFQENYSMTVQDKIPKDCLDQEEESINCNVLFTLTLV